MSDPLGRHLRLLGGFARILSEAKGLPAIGDRVVRLVAEHLVLPICNFYVHDPDKGKLEQHIFAQLKFELLNCKTPYRLCGMTGLPKDYCKEKIIPFEAIQESCDLYEQAMTA